ncbi:sulfite oxidase heme-binding subunit YedZ [Rhodoferax aquaticus]|uniref:Protein-methionine-sulfoxide reductase heme-binding subunit MsrQ n=1 Tax=Rhodoferax aquaticus TaxID=2527691 RepID=A0A515EW30_9BURK|nr:protein-methionine-sulfoxide reductase heme-binding subunit MsrQ [Rhodoferax aquaticus]QDL56858.1 sulfoxide reductase heme-binding subunit YedZ [Rhodoferax aquaticus]
MNQWLLHRSTKSVVFFLGCLPVLWLGVAAWSDQLGANPAEALVRSTGDWTLRILCVVLSITPLRVTFKISALARFRRMLGLFVYFYVVVHFLAYAWLDMGFELIDVGSDLAKRPFIFVGFACLMLLTPLAATSFSRAIKWLGGDRWQMLHRLVYVVAVLALVHFFWMRAGKNNFNEVFVYAAIVAMLLGWRIRNASK